MNRNGLRIFWTVLLLSTLIGPFSTWAAESTPLGELRAPMTTLSVQGKLSFPGALDWYSFYVQEDDALVSVRIEPTADSPDLRLLLWSRPVKWCNGIAPSSC
jgi:hypothetical protein